MKSKNTYSLLVGSEEKGRSIFEGVIYGLVVLSTIFSAWQFAAHPMVIPGMNRPDHADTEMVAQIPLEQPVAVMENHDATAL